MQVHERTRCHEPSSPRRTHSTLARFRGRVAHGTRPAGHPFSAPPATPPGPPAGSRRRARGSARREFSAGGVDSGIYLGRVCCHDSSFRVLGPDPVGTGLAGGGPRRVAARLRAGQADRAAVGHAVPDLDPAGRAGPGRGVLGRRAAGRAPAGAPVRARPRRPGRGRGGPGRAGPAEAAARGGGTCGPAPDGRRGSVMDRCTRVLAGLLGRCARLLPPARRDWAEAVLAEAGEIPAWTSRVAWLAGGLWLVAREVLMRVIRVLAFAAGAAGMVSVGWPGSSSDSAVPLNRVYVVVTVVALAVLPVLVRRYFGPARGSRA